MRRAGDIDPARWRQIREIFEAALDLDVSARTAFLEVRCAGDEALRAEVDDLIEADARLGVDARLETDAQLGAAATGPVVSAPFLESTLATLLPLLAAMESADDVSDPEPPFRWGPLEVTERIGAGSFGRVYRARDSTLRRDVALKLRRVDPTGRTEGGEDHLEEARRLARVRHPNVLVVHGAEVHDGWAGIWTDLVRGESLDLFLRRNGPLSREVLVRVGLDLCAALGAVHGATLVHGDIKPSNAMRDEDGRVLLMDFGSGFSLSGTDDGEADARPLHGSTDHRPRQGTPVAMAPELFDGSAPSASTDIYAVGVLLYRLASGQYPFRAAGLGELRTLLARQDRVPLEELRPDLPSAFARVVHRTLSPDPGRRPATAAELRWLVTASLGTEETGAAEEEDDGAEAATKLPRAATRFVGRALELRQLRSLLIEPGLLTLVGPGGCGKTRLALRLAGELQRSLRDGAFWVDLIGLAEGGDVAALLAQVVGLRDQAGRTTEETLVEWIDGRSLLLVLDNAEHVRRSAAEIAALLLRSCSHLHLLVTTRQQLSLEGERIFRLPPMAVPSNRGVADGLEVLESDAVRLFLDRAQRGGDELRLTAATAPLVARIVRRVEGIPLAIELAAARVAALGLAAVATRLDESFRLLANRDRPTTDRHATLLASIAWSYELLSPEERRVLARLSVFVGGWSLPAAERVCADPPATAAQGPSEPAPISGADVVDFLSALVERSLVTVATSQADEPCYRLLESVRAFAAEKLEATGEAETLFDTHLAWIEQEAIVRGPAIHGPEMAHQIAWFDRERDNVRGALRRSHALVLAGRGSADRCVSLCLNVRPYWYHRGHLREGLENFRLALSGTPKDSASRALGLVTVSHFHASLGDPESAMEAALESLSISRTQNIPNTLATALTMLAGLHTDFGRHDEARGCFEEALAVRASAQNHPGSIVILCNLGVLEASIGDLAAAQTWYERALDLARRHRDDSSIGHVSANLALTMLELGQLEGVRELATESLRAIRRTSSVASLWIGIRPMVLIEIADGRLQEARSHVLEGLSAHSELPRVPSWVGMLDTVVDLLGARGQAAEAAEILGSIDAAREQTGLANPAGFRVRWDQRRDRLRDVLGEDSFQSAWARGRVHSMAEAWAFARQVI